MNYIIKVLLTSFARSDRDSGALFQVGGGGGGLRRHFLKLIRCSKI